MSEPRTRPEPLTDPADLFNLIGRFFLTLVLNVLILFSLFQRNFVSVAVLSLASLFMHRATILLWKRLRNERLAAEQEREKQKGAA